MEETLKNYSWLANLMVIAICAWLLASLVSTYLAQRFSTESLVVPLSRDSQSPASLAEIPNGKEAILKRNLFNRDLNTQEENEAPGPFLSNGIPAVKTELKINLLGTVVTPDPEKSIATVQFERASKRYHQGELMDGRHEIRSIERGRIEFINKDSRRLEFLAFPLHDPPKPRTRSSGVASGSSKTVPGGIAQINENEFVIDAREWERSLANLNQIITQARAVPNIVDGKTDGFRVFAIRPGSIYQKLGIQNGDVLSIVNGKAIDTINSALSVFETLKNEKNFEIQLKRGGIAHTHKYEIK